MKKFLKITVVAVLLHSSLCTAAQEEAKDTIAQTYNIEEFEIVGKKNIRNNPAKTSVGHHTSKP